MGEPITQVPSPLHVLAGIWLPPEQLEGLHTVPAAYFEQPPMPLHNPLEPQVSGVSFLHRPWGSGASLAIAVHSPMCPAWLQLVHAPVQARLQHTPSAQKPESQSSFFVQVAPSGRRPQLPPAHVRPSHWAALVQLVKHLPLPVSHWN